LSICYKSQWSDRISHFRTILHFDFKYTDADKDDEEEDDLFADSDDEEKSKVKPGMKANNSALTKRERMEALQKKKRMEATTMQRKKSSKPESLTKSNPSTVDNGKEKGYDSGDSYDSAAFERTKEDNDFIDIEGEDEDAVRELYAEQHFDDERPDSSDDENTRSRKKKKSSVSKSRGPDHVSDNEDKDNPIMEVVNKMKRIKRASKKLSELEDEAKAFITKMDNAADEDEESYKAKQPSTKKLALLSEAVDMLTRRDMVRILLDMDVLASCKRWIQPLPNGHLGNVTVRQRILEAISNMTGERGIVSNDLKRSGIGQTVMILYKHKSETPNMKRDLKKLIEQWSRPIFQKSGNMKDLEHVHAARRPTHGITSMAAQRKSPSSTSKGGTTLSEKRNHPDSLQTMLSASGRSSASSSSKNRVRVPYSTGFDFQVRPQFKTGDVQDKRMVATSSSSSAVDANRGTLSKRMTEKGRAAMKNQRSANISTVGRPVK
jgi:transcription factor SPN1